MNNNQNLIVTKNKLKPYQDQLNDLKTIIKENYEKNQKSSLITFNNDFNNLDKKLELLVQKRDELLNQKNQFVLLLA